MSFNAQPLDLTVGALLVGMTVTCSLSGILTAQTAYFYKHYPRDRCFLKTLVAAVWALDALQQVFYMATVWGWLVEKKAADIDGHPLLLTANIQLVINAVLVCLVQLFYAGRVWTLSKNSIPLTGISWILIFASLALSLTLCVKSSTVKDAGDLYTVSGIGIALNSVTAMADLFLTGALCCLLAKSRTGSTGTSRLVNRLLLFCLNTGILTTVCAVTALAMLVAFPGSSLYVIFYFMGGRLYSISLLGTLNARATLRRQIDGTDHLSGLGPRSRLSIRHPPADTYASALRLESPGPPEFRSHESDDGSSGAYDDERSPRDGKGKSVSLPAFSWE
ncbi:hypothetical protein C8Q73DRAFT_672379 [Cubamyces lactineus]|nr:hypothetical protein C8Q73DRAFT_672379 [Cubamyces lactineus]